MQKKIYSILIVNILTLLIFNSTALWAYESISPDYRKLYLKNDRYLDYIVKFKGSSPNVVA